MDNPAWQWSWYGHFTFRDYLHPESANKAWMNFTHGLNREIFAHYYWKHKDKGIIWARASENQSRGALHYHAILGCIPERIDNMKYKEIWNDMCGFARIYLYECGRGAEYYMSKSAYAWKQGQIDFGGPIKERLEYEQRSFPTE